VKRVLVVLGILIALTLVCATAFLTFDADDPAADDPPPSTRQPQPKPSPPKPEPRRAGAPTVSEAKTVRRRTQPARPSGLGTLVVAFGLNRPTGDEPQPRATVLLPTGEALATSLVAKSDNFCRFTGLPTGLPLVVRVDAQGFLSGLCCDVVLSDATTVLKNVDLVPAPFVAVRVLSMPRAKRMKGVGVELLQHDDVLATGTTDGDGLALVRAPGVGQFRVRVAADGYPPPPESVVDVWPGDEIPEVEVEVRAGGGVEVVVVTANGVPAPGVEVWLVGDRATAPSVRTDRRGVAKFASVPASLELTAVARAEGGVARAKVVTQSDATQRVPLLLKAQAPLEGDVVDPGGGAVVNASVAVVVRPFTEPVTTRSDASGHFVTPPLPAGLAQVTVRREGFVEWTAERPVEIEPATGGRVKARLVRLPTGAVVVAVRDESGAPLVDVAVTLYPSETSATTAADGTCRIEGLPAGVEQSVVARRRGYRATRSASSPPPVVRVQADVAQGAEVVLRSVHDASPAGDVSATGLVLDPSSRPVVGAQVDAGAVRAFTADDGSFRLEGLARVKAGGALEIRVTPDRWMLEPFRCFVDVDPSGVAEFGTVRLRSRPYALLRLPPPTASSMPRPNTGKSKLRLAKASTRGGTPAATPTFWLSYNHDDELLGRRTRRFEAFACVSYDGAWLHLPPADDWKRDGRGEVFVAAPTPRGLLSGRATWTQTADAAAALRLAFESRPGAFTVFWSADKGTEGKAVFRQIACASLFDPRSIHVPTGDEQRPVDPFASLVACRSFAVDDLRVGATVEGLAPGRWRVEMAGGIATEATVPDEVRIYLDR